MAKFSLGKPITIGGEEVVVVRDVLGSLQADKATETFAIVEPRSSDGRPAIYVSENDLSRLRDDYPGVKVYGLWQILFHNNAVRLGAPLVTFQLTDSGGLYLLIDATTDMDSPESILSSGEYLNGYIPDNFDVDINTANVINVDLHDLKLPPQPAYTRLEQSGKLKAENKRRWFVVGSLCGLIIVGAAAANYGLQTIYKSRMAEYNTKRTLIDELDGRVKSLASERLITRPNDSAMLSQLFTFFELYPMASTPPLVDDMKIGFTGSHVLVTPENAPVDPATVVPGVVTELQPDLSYKATFSEVETEDGLSSLEGSYE